MEDKWNIKPRLVVCYYCKIEVVTDKPAPRCEKCDHEMVTVVRKNVEN